MTPPRMFGLLVNDNRTTARTQDLQAITAYFVSICFLSTGWFSRRTQQIMVLVTLPSSTLQTSPRLIVFVRTSLRPRVSVLYLVEMQSNTGRTRQKKIKSTVTGLSSEYVVDINHISSQPAEGRESIRPHRCISSSSGPVIDKAPLSLSTAAMSSLLPIVPCRA